MMSKNWRLHSGIGGWDNQLVNVPAGAVREIIEELESSLTEHSELLDALRITLTYGLPPHDVSGTEQWAKAREIYKRVSGKQK